MSRKTRRQLAYDRGQAEIITVRYDDGTVNYITRNELEGIAEPGTQKVRTCRIVFAERKEEPEGSST